MPKVKVTLSLDQDMVQTLDTIGRQSRKPRSRVVQEALGVWRRTCLEKQLADGYRAMATEDRETAERSIPAFAEILE